MLQQTPLPVQRLVQVLVLPQAQVQAQELPQAQGKETAQQQALQQQAQAQAQALQPWFPRHPPSSACSYRSPGSLRAEGCRRPPSETQGDQVW